MSRLGPSPRLRGARGICALGLAVALTAVAGCKKDGDGKAAGPDAALVTRGKAVYTTVCLACHNANPTLDGALGPGIAGASLELLRAKVLENKYPPGYKPKRTTSQMVPLPQVKGDLDALAAYLRSVQ